MPACAAISNQRPAKLAGGESTDVPTLIGTAIRKDGTCNRAYAALFRQLAGWDDV